MKGLLFFIIFSCAVLRAAAPTTVSITPNAVTGTNASFVMVFRDADGYADIALAQLTISANEFPHSACYIQYIPSAGKLFLQDDSVTPALRPITPGVTGTVENSYCILSGAGSSVSGSGNDLTVTAAIIIKSSFAGVKTLSLSATDSVGSMSSTDNRGTFRHSSVTYYVDQTGGNDSNSGVSAGAAWKTINKVNTSTFRPGDFIRFKRGEQWREQLIVPSSGSEGNPITISDYGTGNKPLILGSTRIASWTLDSGSVYRNNAVTWGAKIVFANGVFLAPVAARVGMKEGTFYLDERAHIIYVWLPGNADASTQTIEVGRYSDMFYGLVQNGYLGNDWIVYENLELRYVNWFGFRFYGGKHITVRNNKVTYCYSNAVVGIGTQQGAPENPDSITIVDNEIRHGGWRRNEPGGVGAEGIAIDSSDGFVMSRNIVDDWYGEGIVAAFAAKAGFIEDNLVTNVHMSGAIYLSGSGGVTMENIMVRRNVIDTGTHANSIVALLVSVEGTGTIRNCKLTHNTIANWPHGYGLVIGHDNPASIVTNIEYAHNTVVNLQYGILLAGNANIQNNMFRNNIVYTTNRNALGLLVMPLSNPNNTFDHNLYYIPNYTTPFSWLGAQYNLAGFKAAVGKELSSVNANPLFTNAEDGDYTLQAGSPAIGGALMMTGIEQSRQGVWPDIGAYEYAPGKLGSSSRTTLRNRYKTSIYP